MKEACVTVLLVIALLLLVLGLSAAALPVTTPQPSVIPVPMLQVGVQNSPQDNGTADQGDDLKVFGGKIVSLNGSLFILRDDTNQVWYHLDDQTTARKFAGKDVDVKGKLDERTDVIHVQSMEEQKKVRS